MNKKGQASGITWMIAFIVIFFIMFLFITFSLTLIAKKTVSKKLGMGEISSIRIGNLEGDLILTHQLTSFLDSPVYFNRNKMRMIEMVKIPDLKKIRNNANIHIRDKIEYEDEWLIAQKYSDKSKKVFNKIWPSGKYSPDNWQLVVHLDEEVRDTTWKTGGIYTKLWKKDRPITFFVGGDPGIFKSGRENLVCSEVPINKEKNLFLCVRENVFW